MVSTVYNIPDNLSDLATEFGNNGRYKSHIIFVLLYKNVTDEWISYAEKTESRLLIFSIIEKFYQKYQKYVINHIYQLENKNTANHWRIYFDLIEKREPFKNILHFFELVYASAFAHTRYDLAEAIEETLQEHPEIYTDSRKLAQLKVDLVGIPSNDIFQVASEKFLRSIVITMGNNQPTGMKQISSLNFAFTQSVWIKKFQSWRNLAWHDAVRAACVQTK